MKLVNKNTTNIKVFGEIVPCNEYGRIAVKTDQGVTWYYRSLAELNEEWEDYEEPKESKKYWFINSGGESVSYYEEDEEPEDTEACKEIGNYFESLEEAEKAVEKLKAWKRLKDKGVEVIGWTIDDGLRISISTNTDEDDVYDEDKRGLKKDLDSCFGGEV